MPQPEFLMAMVLTGRMNIANLNRSEIGTWELFGNRTSNGNDCTDKSG